MSNDQILVNKDYLLYPIKDLSRLKNIRIMEDLYYDLVRTYQNKKLNDELLKILSEHMPIDFDTSLTDDEMLDSLFSIKRVFSIQNNL